MRNWYDSTSWNDGRSWSEPLPPLPGPSRREWLVAGLLFVATLVTTTVAGVLGSPELARLLERDPELARRLPELLVHHWTLGLPFSATLLVILGTHELGHFVASRCYGIPTSPPYFIPAPTLIGTFGAVIRIRGWIGSRKGLLEVGAAGPIAGFLLAVPAYVWGMAHSTVVTDLPASGELLRLGDSLLTWTIQRLVMGPLPAGADVVLHPVAFAAWIGLFVTALNMIPMGQFDGGHVLFALSPRLYRLVARGAFVGLLLLGFAGWYGWFLWAAIAAWIGVTRHPPPRRFEPVLDPGARATAWFALVILLLTFVPVPFTISP